MSNLRRFSRINFHATSFLKFKGESTQVELENISMKGALIQPLNSTDVQLGDIVSLEMKLNSSSHFSHTNPEKSWCAKPNLAKLAN